MEKAGIELHAYAHISELFDVCEQQDLIDDAKRRELAEFVKES